MPERPSINMPQSEQLHVNDTLHAHAYYYFVQLCGYHENISLMSQQDATRVFHSLIAQLPGDALFQSRQRARQAIEASASFIKGETYEQIGACFGIGALAVRLAIGHVQERIRAHLLEGQRAPIDLSVIWQPTEVSYDEVVFEQRKNAQLASYGTIGGSLREVKRLPTAEQVAKERQERLARWEQMATELQHTGSAELFEQLTAEYYPFLLEYARRMQGPRRYALVGPEDAVQAAFTNTWVLIHRATNEQVPDQATKKSRIPYASLPYFQKAIEHFYIDYHKSMHAKTTDATNEIAEDAVGLFSAQELGTEQTVVQREQQVVIRAALREVFRALPERSRPILYDLWMGMSQSEAAKKYDMSLIAIRGVRGRARTIARRILTNMGIDTGIFMDDE